MKVKKKAGGGKSKTKLPVSDGSLIELSAREKRFCDEYIRDFDSRRAFVEAGFTANNTDTMKSSIYKLLHKDSVAAYLKRIQADAEAVVGISRAEILQHHYNIAKTSIAHLHKTWITREDFEKLTDEQKACISELDVKVSKIKDAKGKEIGVTEHVKIKLYDRQKALDSISRMLGYDEPSKLNLVADKEKITQLFPFGK